MSAKGYRFPKSLDMTYEEQREILIAYLNAKVDVADWHGVSDAANDLRVLEAQHETMEHVKQSGSRR